MLFGTKKWWLAVCLLVPGGRSRVARMMSSGVVLPELPTSLSVPFAAGGTPPSPPGISRRGRAAVFLSGAGRLRSIGAQVQPIRRQR